MKKVLKVYCKRNQLKWQINGLLEPHWYQKCNILLVPLKVSHLSPNTRLGCSSTVQRTKLDISVPALWVCSKIQPNSTQTWALQPWDSLWVGYRQECYKRAFNGRMRSTICSWVSKTREFPSSILILCLWALFYCCQRPLDKLESNQQCKLQT